MYPKDVHKKILLNSAAYLLYDFTIYYFIVGANDWLAYQTYAHHILGALSFYLAMYTGSITVLIGNLTLLMEASTIFLNIRWYSFELNIKNLNFAMINSGLLFLTYFFTRILFQNYFSFKFSYPLML